MSVMWSDLLRSLAHAAEQGVDRRRRPRAGVPTIAPFRGFGKEGELVVRGRVLLEKRVTRAREAEPLWRNLLNSYRRFSSAEVPGARVRAMFREAVVETVTDEEGYFRLRLESDLIDRGRTWQEVGLMLSGGAAPVTAPVLVPSPTARFGVISDIDDTVVQTGATSLREMVRTVLLQNAATRTPFEGVRDLYRALHAGHNPLFYVSSGPWNLYDLIHDFFDLQGIPHGPLFLQDWGLDEETLITRAHELHKLREINALLDYYNALPFVLIGDSGQHDPEIYLEVIRSHPGRVRAAIIRDVSGQTRDSAVGRIAGEALAAGVEMLLVPDSAAALREAQRLGLVE